MYFFPPDFPGCSDKICSEQMHKLQRGTAFYEPVATQTAKQMTNLTWAHKNDLEPREFDSTDYF